MAFTPTTVGQAKGLLAQPTDYTNQLIGATKYKEAKEAAKKKGEDDDFQKMLGDIKVDFSKYHRLDRDRVKQMVAADLGEMEKAYRTGNPNWRNIAYERGYDLKFKVQQALVDSQKKFEFEKYMEEPASVKTPQAQAVYQWYKQGEFGAPPQIVADEFGQINAFDPATGTVGFVPATQTNIPQFADKSIFEPALEGYMIKDATKSTALPTGERQYIQEGVYNPDMVRAAIYSSTNSPAFNTWRVENGDALRALAQANPSVPPQEIIMAEWEKQVMGMQPKKFQTTIQQPQKAMNVNVNVGGQEEDKYSTRFTSLSNLLKENAGEGITNYTELARQTGGKVTGDNKVVIPVPEESVGKPVVIQGSRVFAHKDGKGPIVRAPQDGVTSGIPEQMEVRWGKIFPNGEYSSYDQKALDNMSPEERSALQPILLIKYKATEANKLPEDVDAKGFKKAPSTFYAAYNLSEGSSDLSELNNQYPNVYVNIYQKTMREAGKKPSAPTKAVKTQPGAVVEEKETIVGW